MRNKLKMFFAQACMILGIMMLTFYVTDLFNSAGEFIDNDITKTLLALFSVCAIGLGAMTVIDKYKK